MKITLPVVATERRETRKPLAMRMHLAEGSVGDEEFNVYLSINGGALYIEFADARYDMTIDEVVRAVLNHRGHEVPPMEIVGGDDAEAERERRAYGAS